MSMIIIMSELKVFLLVLCWYHTRLCLVTLSIYFTCRCLLLFVTVLTVLNLLYSIFSFYFSYCDILGVGFLCGRHFVPTAWVLESISLRGDGPYTTLELPMMIW